MRSAWKSRVPFVPQLEAADCGAACLAMLLRSYGNYAPLDQVRSACKVSGSGTSAFDLAQAAEDFGLEVSAFKVGASGWRALGGPVIAHCRRGHFVVVVGASRRQLALLDPGRGRRELSNPAADEELSGVVLSVKPRPGFRQGPPPDNEVGFVRRAVVPLSARLAGAVGLFLLTEAPLTAVPWLMGRWAQARNGPIQGLGAELEALALALVFAGYAVAYLLRDLQLHRLRERLELRLLSGASHALLAARQQQHGDRSRENAAEMVEQASSFERLVRALVPAPADVLCVLAGAWLLARDSLVLSCVLLAACAVGLALRRQASLRIEERRRHHDSTLERELGGLPSEAVADNDAGAASKLAARAWAEHRAAVDRGELWSAAAYWLPALSVLGFAHRFPLGAALSCVAWLLINERRVQRLAAIGPSWREFRWSTQRLVEAMDARPWLVPARNE